MDLETYIGITIAVVVILALSLAISLKIYGETRWLLGIAMVLVGAFTLFMGFSLVILVVTGDEDLDWRGISGMVVLVSGALATLGTTFKRFRQLGSQGPKTLESDPFSFTIDTHSMEDFAGNTTDDNQEAD